MANEKDRRAVLDYYERVCHTFRGTTDEKHKAALGSQMVAIVEISKLLRVHPSWFPLARSGWLSLLLGPYTHQANEKRKTGHKNSKKSEKRW